MRYRKKLSKCSVEANPCVMRIWPVSRLLLAGLLWIGLSVPVFADAMCPSVQEAQDQKFISIIIDDLGYRKRSGLRALELPGALTYAILPHTPFGKRMAEIAAERGSDILLHQPMQFATGSDHTRLGAGALYLNMDRRRFVRTLEENLALFPGIIGVSNHMGSLLSRDMRSMQWVMEVLGARDLIYVDSLTSPRSVAHKVAQRNAVPFLRRNIFLDNQATLEYAQGQFDRLVDAAHSKGYAIAIGHPYPDTLDMLHQRLSDIERHGVRLIGIRCMVEVHALRDDLVTRRLPRVGGRRIALGGHNKDPAMCSGQAVCGIRTESLRGSP